MLQKVLAFFLLAFVVNNSFAQDKKALFYLSQGENEFKLRNYAKALDYFDLYFARDSSVANAYFMGCINRVGTEKPWNLGHFYGSSYFVNPLGQILACASEDKDELLVCEFDLDLITEVRSKWQFYRDRRPESYDEIVAP